jgi:hypothetical protein
MNNFRGEAEIQLGGKKYPVTMNLGALADMASKLNLKTFVALINSRPRSPTVDELEAIIARGLLRASCSCSALRLADLKALYTDALRRRAARSHAMHITEAAAPPGAM